MTSRASSILCIACFSKIIVLFTATKHETSPHNQVPVAHNICNHLHTNTKTLEYKYKNILIQIQKYLYTNTKKGIQIETQKKIICWNLVLAKATIVNMSTLMKFP